MITARHHTRRPARPTIRRPARPTTRRPTRPGFTLIEMVIALALFGILSGMIFGVATQTISLTSEVVKSQNKSSTETAFFELLNRQFSSLPGNARFELVSSDSGAQYLSDLTIENVPMTFNWGGTAQIARAVQLSTVRRRDGFLDIVLRYYEDPILEETSEVGSSIEASSDNEPFAEVVLLEDIYIFEWRVLDGRTGDWTYDWDLAGRLPLQLELTFVVDSADTDVPIRQVFWVTPKQNPEVLMRQLEQDARNGGAGGGAPGGNQDGDDDQGPQIEIGPQIPGGTNQTGGDR